MSMRLSWRGVLIALALCPVLFSPGGAPLVAQNKGVDPALVDDPLLREPWIDAESRRARGLVHRIGGILEKPRSKFVIRDFADREFEMNLRGRLSFNPYDDNWKVVVPRLNSAPLHTAEADGLYRSGRVIEALEIWKALIAMARFAPGATASNRVAALDAAARVNAMRDKHEDFKLYDYVSDPYIYYDDARDETLVLSDRHGWRARLPGAWSFRRGRVDLDPARDTDLRETLVYLRQGGLTLTLGADAFTAARRIPDLYGLIWLWDTRRTLSPQRKRLLDFQRGPHATSADVCGGGSLTRSPPGRRDRLARVQRLLSKPEWTCVVARSRVAYPDRRPVDVERYRMERGEDPPARPRLRRLNFFEFYHLRPWHGFYLAVEYDEKDAAGAESTLRRVLGWIHFSG